MSIRSRFRSGPCRIGWHYPVLTWDGKSYRKICEHCGKDQ